MPKKSNSDMANKSHKGHSQKSDHSHKSGPGARPGSAGGQPKKNHESRPSPGHGNAFDDVGKSAGGNDSAFDNIGKLGGGKKSKDGCLPKLFMLFLPLMAVGAYFLFYS